MGGGRRVFFSLHRKWRHCWAFLVMVVGLSVQVRLCDMYTPRNFMLLTVLTAEPLMWSGVQVAGLLLKSPTISFVFSTFKDRLLSQHQLTSCLMTSLYADFLVLSNQLENKLFWLKQDGGCYGAIILILFGRLPPYFPAIFIHTLWKHVIVYMGISEYDPGRKMKPVTFQTVKKKYLRWK